jgi:hypothetical protein
MRNKYDQNNNTWTKFWFSFTEKLLVNCHQVYHHQDSLNLQKIKNPPKNPLGLKM